MAARRARWLFALLLAPLAVVAMAVLLLWFWAAREGSLAATLRLASTLAAPTVVLQADGVQGTLRTGGQVARLQMQAAGWQAELSGLRLRWQPLALLDGHLQIEQLTADSLRLQAPRAPHDDSPAQAPHTLRLPLDLSVPLALQHLVLDGPVKAEARDLALQLDYRRATQQHRLRLDRVQWADGRYQGEATLGAEAPMALQARLQAQVTARVPGTPRLAALRGEATLQGALRAAASTTPGATPDAAPLRLQLQVQASSDAPTAATRATLNAELDPWAAQPVREARADWHALDLAAWWPGAPRTLLAGWLAVQPEAVAQWRAHAELSNQRAGPWSGRHLPVESLSVAALVHSRDGDSPDVTVQRLQARAAGGEWSASGRWQPRSAQPWQGELRIRGANPAAVLAALPSVTLDGEAQAQASGAGLAFTVSVQPAARQPAAASARGMPADWPRGSARGRFEAGTLTLERWQLQAGALQAEGQARLQPAARRGDAQLQLQGPGLQLRLQGSSAPDTGTGTVALQVDDAARVQRALMPWIAPWLAQPLPALDGQLRLDANWQGGWARADALRLDVQLAAPRLNIGAADPDDALALQAVTLQARGTLADTAAQLRGNVTRGAWQARLDAALRGGRLTDQWQAQLQQLQVQLMPAQPPATITPPWRLVLAAPVAARWRDGSGTPVAELDAGEARLSSPAAGTATLAWQPVRAEFTAAGLTLDSSGQLRDLPLDWIELTGQRLQDLGLAGDLRFEGQWALRMAGALQLEASLSRRSGDLRMLADDGSGQPVRAGVREASLHLQADGEQLQGQLVWDTQNAGQAQAQLRTRLARGAEGWHWPANAPLQGTLRASLPRMATWSVLAPPGWRVQGTLDANATIAGTRAQPQWSGTLNADDLALRAALEGISLSGGTLRTRFDGPRLDIDTFSLRGAGPQGGRLQASGYAQWLPATGAGAGLAPGLGRVRIELNARAEGLRAGDRADRRLAVSGELRALLAHEKLQVRGALKADQARLVLPDEGTPSLGIDVVVRRTPRPGATAAAPGASSTRGQRVMPDVAVTLDLGDDFQVQGRGLRTRLAGALNLTLDSGAAPQALRLRGEIRTERGTFRAYQQQLAIERGLLRFNGPWDNPVLDIVAIRPGLPQRAGVQVTGTALSPRIRLYSEPQLSDADTLAWLLLGRAAAAGAAESAMLQQALLAVLGNGLPSPGGALAGLLGIDELGVSAQRDADGREAAAVTVGKRIARNFYVSYERSLAGTVGTLYIFYDLSRRLTLRAQAGEQSAVDLIFTLPYD